MWVVATGLALCAVGDALPFNIVGLRSGMSREQASAVLNEGGSRVFPNQSDPNLLVASRGGVTHVLKFCQNRLESYSFALLGGKETFNRQADVMTRERGIGQPETFSVERGDPIDSMGLSWRKDSEYVKLSHVAASAAHEESVSVTYIDDGVCK